MSSKRRAASCFISTLVLTSTFAWTARPCDAQQGKKPFTVADEIGLTYFGDPYTGKAEALLFSPNGNYFAVRTERGRLELNRVEDSLRFYRTHDLVNSLKDSAQSHTPSPIWQMSRSATKAGSISDWRWLADSSGVVFLEERADGNRLILADLLKKMVKPLTSATGRVQAFDVLDRQHYIYTIAGLARQEKMQNESGAVAIVGTGRKLSELLFPHNSHTQSTRLWVVVGGKHFEVKENGKPLFNCGLFNGAMALSPDSTSVVTTVPVTEVPLSWETLYSPPVAFSPYRIHSSGQDRLSASFSLQRYVRINLQTGFVQVLTDAPTAYRVGYWAWVESRPIWSADGQEIILPGTFLRSNDHPSFRPCIAVVDLPSNASSCVEMLKSHTDTGIEEGYHGIKDVYFVGGDKRRVRVIYMDHLDFSYRSTDYRRTTDGSWQVAAQGALEVGLSGLKVSVKEGLNDPPVLVAANDQTSQVIFDPNPQLERIDLGQANVYRWRDEEGREWKGGLYKPINYKPGRRYPLVIQTHGFRESEFRPSGIFPTAFAARALAAIGITVLQVDDRCAAVTIDEGPCMASGYAAAANQLIAEGLVDPERIGIIGFSRTCFYVMQTLTTGSLHLKAASITDGFMVDYFQYVLVPELATESDRMIGAPPFGEGLQQWIKRSPSFNLDKIRAPLLVVGEGRFSLLTMWHAYAGLYSLQKPVDVMMLKTDEHVLSSPAMRMASQGGTVDWFRFWLQDREDSDPVKAEQYARWRQLRKLQEANERNSATPQGASN